MKRVTVTFDVATEDDAEAVRLVNSYLTVGLNWLEFVHNDELSQRITYSVREVE